MGLAILSYLAVVWFQGQGIGTRPLLSLGILLTITSLIFLSIGLLAELLVRTTLRPEEIYSIRKVHTRASAVDVEGNRLSVRPSSSKPAAKAQTIGSEAPAFVAREESS